MGKINPGPGPTTSEGTKPSEKNNVKIAHLNVRSLKQRDHFIQVKDTVQKTILMCSQSPKLG